MSDIILLEERPHVLSTLVNYSYNQLLFSWKRSQLKQSDPYLVWFQIRSDWLNDALLDRSGHWVYDWVNWHMIGIFCIGFWFNYKQINRFGAQFIQLFQNFIFRSLFVLLVSHRSNETKPVIRHQNEYLCAH